MMSLSLSWTCQKDRALFLVKFGLTKIILFKYRADVENCGSSKDFDFIYTSMQFVLTHGNINNCDDKMFILVDSVSTLGIMNGSNLTPTFKNQIGHIAQN